MARDRQMAQAPKTRPAAKAGASKNPAGAKAATQSSAGVNPALAGGAANPAASDIAVAMAEAATGVQGAIDVAVAALSQSYAHAMSLAFQDTVLDRQRRAILAQAAMTRALMDIRDAPPGLVDEKLAIMRSGIDMLTAPDRQDMDQFSGISQQFQAAVENLIKLKNNLNS